MEPILSFLKPFGDYADASKVLNNAQTLGINIAKVPPHPSVLFPSYPSYPYPYPYPYQDLILGPS